MFSDKPLAAKPFDGRKHAPEYAKYHLATYGNDWNYLHAN